MNNSGYNIFQNVIGTGVKLELENTSNGFCKIILGEYLPYNEGELNITAVNQDGQELFNEDVSGTNQEVFFDTKISDSTITLFFSLKSSVTTCFKISSIELFKMAKVVDSPFLQKQNLKIAFLMDSWGEFPNLISGETPINRADGTEANGLQFISNHLKDYLTGLGFNVETYNNSHGGMTSAWAKYWLKELVLDLSEKPDYCVINFAINDMNSISFATGVNDSVYDFFLFFPHVKLVQSSGGIKGSVTQAEWLNNMNYIVKTLLQNNIQPIWMHNPMLDGISFGLIEQNNFLINNQ